MVVYLTRTARVAVVIAVSGMCGGGRIVNDPKAMLRDPCHDILFIGYQAAGTLRRDIKAIRNPGQFELLRGALDLTCGSELLYNQKLFPLGVA